MAAGRRSLAAVVVALALVLAAATTASAKPDTPSAPTTAPPTSPGRYIVTLADRPVASYDGGVKGYAATKPANGRKVSLTSTQTKRYRTFLRDKQATIARSVGARADQQFSIALNGFVADLTAAQAQQLQRTAGVLSVVKDQRVSVTDNRRSTDFLKLSGRSGVWSKLGGTARAGQGVVVGVLDTGIWPESKSFAGDKLGYAPPNSKKTKYRPYRLGSSIVMHKSDGSRFAGTCVPGAPGGQWSSATCNTKVIGARYFGENLIASLGADQKLDDYLSPRDDGGHGSHTASTAAGNYGVRAVADGRHFGRISGVAPAAKIAVYKVLWHLEGDPEETGMFSDILDGIEAAVGDGVDVINYSIGTSSESSIDNPVSIAFLNAAAAGIFVSTSAGNNGPGPSTLDNTFPWVTTVAASTVKPWEGTVALGNGAKYAGISTTVTSKIGPAALVNAAAVGLTGKPADQVTLCTPGTLDPAKVRGKIIVCDRGVVARVDKSAEVKRAGGVGMVLVNLTENSQDGDLHSVPTVHLSPPAAQAVKEYAARSAARATLVPGNTTKIKIPYPQIAGFSSRGPSLSAGGDLLKPDIAAPGVTILAAVAPPSNSGRSFDFYSGTSMAAPHIAGLGAILLGDRAHPTWSPMRIKSALMTTAVNAKTAKGKAETDPYAQGAGQVYPKHMFNPGLVYDSGVVDWWAFMEGLGIDTDTGIAPKDPSDLNMPAIAIGKLVASQKVTRTVTAVRAGRYRVNASIPGVKVKVSPSTLNFAHAGQKRTFTVTLTRTSAALGETAHGFLTWKSSKASARIPLAVVPAVVAAPDEVSGAGAAGSVNFRVIPGLSGAFRIKAFGLDAATSHTGQVTSAPTTEEFDATVPDGAKVARFTVNADQPAADIDLYLYRVENGQQVLVAISGSSTGNESLTLVAPDPGDYVVQVAGFADAPGTSATTFVQRTTVVGSDHAFGFAVTPGNPTATAGKPLTVTASWSGTDPSTPYLGWVEYPDGSGTVVAVN